MVLLYNVAWVSAAPNDIVINELMYHPVSDNEDDEYIELHNTTASPIDLEGWCFTDGVALCFNPGTTIAANGYLIVSPDAGQTLTTYGEAVEATYTGNLSNGGETVTLEDDTSAIVSTVTYDDTTPWPITPDEEGPSLELNDPLGDTTSPANWGASIGGPTPNAQNSIYQSEVPVITNVTDPNGVADGADVNVTADVSVGTMSSVELNYKINFDADVTLTMYDDGAHNDGAAADGVYGATIPGQSEGTLVRFNIEATNGDGTTTSPRYDDTQNYHGYYVAPSVATNAQQIDWFISDADYDALQLENVADKNSYSTVIVIGDDVYDNSEIRLKGEFSATFPKKSYKIKLPRGYGHSLSWDNNNTSTDIREFHLNGDNTSEGISRMPLGFWVAEQAGLPVPDLAVTRLQKNGAFEGLYVAFDKYEEEWRKDNGYNDGELYEDYWDIIDGATDYTSINAWRDDMQADRSDPNRIDDVLDQNNIPALLNYMSTMTLARSHDHSFMSNTFTFKSEKTGRWEALLWDMDLLFQDRDKMATPYDLPDYIESSDRWATTAMYDDPILRSLHFRRLRTLTDKLYENDTLLNKYKDINDLHRDDINLENAKWPAADGFFISPESRDEFVINRNRFEILAFLKTPWGVIPDAQTDAERQLVEISQAVSSVANANEYIEISNSASTPVDISDWYVEGIDYTIPAGSVVPAGGSIFLLRDDIGYRASHASVLVAGQYETDLSLIPGSELVLKTDEGVEIDTYVY